MHLCFICMKYSRAYKLNLFLFEYYYEYCEETVMEASKILSTAYEERKMSPANWAPFVTPRMLQEFWLRNQVPLPVLVCQQDEVTQPISVVVLSWMKWTRMSSIVISFHRGHEEPPRELKWKINLCPWILRWICGRGYIYALDFWLRSAGCPNWSVSPFSSLYERENLNSRKSLKSS